jgi:hypothetical protein
MLMVYWLSGCFTGRNHDKFQQKLLDLDRRLLKPILGNPGLLKPRWLATSLELAYLFCYPLVPLGVLVLYLTGNRDRVDSYWGTVLPATYGCYLLLPFVQTMPPRLVAAGSSRKSGRLGNAESRPSSPGLVRTFNLFILDRASITINTFPSAHVAATMAASFALMSITPGFGLLSLVIAIGIASGAVLGRYHYAADAILAAALAAVAFQLRHIV